MIRLNRIPRREIDVLFLIPRSKITACNCIALLSYGLASDIDNKKDGYRQQNVRQLQKLISIIDYYVCMTFVY